MDLTRNVCSAALSLRKARQLRVRLPLASLTVAHEAAPALSEFADIIKDEVNVKDLVLDGDPATLGEFQLTVNPRVLGPRLGKQVQEVIRAVKAGQWTQAGDVVTAAGVELRPGEYELKLTAADPDSTTALPGSNGLIALDPTVTPELVAEGTARDVVRVIQQARKDAGLDVSDRITLVVGADGAVADAVRAHAAFIAGETLATEPDRGLPPRRSPRRAAAGGRRRRGPSRRSRSPRLARQIIPNVSGLLRRPARSSHARRIFLRTGGRRNIRYPGPACGRSLSASVHWERAAGRPSRGSSSALCRSTSGLADPPSGSPHTSSTSEPNSRSASLIMASEIQLLTFDE